MSKWSPIKPFPSKEQQEKVIAEVKAMTVEQLSAVLVEHGNPEIGDFGLAWFYSLTNEWACISNAFIGGAYSFRMFCDMAEFRRTYYSDDPNRINTDSLRAVVACCLLNLPRVERKTKPTN